MSSKLHKAGIPYGSAAPWQPLSKGGDPAPFVAGQPASNGVTSPGQDLQQRIRELERRLNEERQAAHQRGLQEGEAAGKQVAAQFHTALERLARTIEEVSSLRPGLRHEAEEDIVKLSLAIARRILYREITTDPAALLGLVRAALDKMDGRRVHRVRANSQDAGVLQQFFQQMGLPHKIEVLADPSLPRGAAIFETDHGSLDASVDTQLNEIERGFADMVRRSK